MKKKDILVSLAIIVVSGGVLYFYTQRAGFIQIDAGGVDATLQLRNSLFSGTTVHTGRGPAAVGAGIHRPQHLRLSMGQNGHNYLLLSQGPWGDLARIKVRNDKTTPLRLGPPLSIEPKVRKNGPIVTIEFNVVGRAGELYEKFVRRDNRAMAGASLKIVNKVGRVLESGKFRYG
ncbi:MAG: hypothetical protein P8Z79_19980 [Sedimentisphaerales bacterium]|jgi:hypothetical protein